MERTEQANGGLSEFRWAVGNKRTYAVADLHHADGGEVANARAQAGAADVERFGKFAFRRDFVSRLQSAVFNLGPDVVDHLLGKLRIDCLGFHRNRTRLMKCAELFRTLRLAPENGVFAN